MNGSLQRVLRANPYLLTLALLIVVVAANRVFQDNLFEANVINRNIRVLLPTMLLTVGQTIVIIAGGIDLSVGTMVSMINAILVTQITPESTDGQIVLGILLAIGAGLVAGALNGFCVSFLRLQPIVTTYATSFIFSGIALQILPRPGGQFPRALTDFYRQPQLGIPTAVYAIVLVLLFWIVLRSTRYGQYLFATGSSAQAAFATGVPVSQIRFSSYLWSGFFAALAALALTLLSGSGDPRLGDDLTLPTIVAVVLGGTRLSGGQGGIAGPMMGVAVLTFVRNIVSFANVESWYQDLVNATIIVVALAGPGFFRLIRRLIQR